MVVELETVQQDRPLRKAEDVVGDQIAMTVDDAPVGDTSRQQHPPAVDELHGETLEFIHRLKGQHGSSVMAQLAQVFPQARGDRRDLGTVVDPSRAGALGMKVRNPLRNHRQVALDGFTSPGREPRNRVRIDW